MAEAERPFWRTLYFWVLVAIALGVLVGWLWPELGQALKPLGDGFIKLVKMIITPVIFLTVVTGIAGMADLKAFGRVGAKAMAYFLTFSTLALGDRPGRRQSRPAGRRAQRRSGDARYQARSPTYVSQAHEQSVTGFLLHIIPDTLFSAFTSGEILQVLFVVDPVRHRAGAARREAASGCSAALRTLTAVVFRIVHILMYAAPIGAFGAMAFTIGQYGIGTLANLAALIATFYATSLAVRDRRARADRAGRRLLDLRPDPLHQGRAAARARHLLARKARCRC